MAEFDPFATAADMAQRSQGEITATSHPFLEKELRAASSAIRAYCGWHVAQLAEVTHVRRRRWREDVWLPAMEISAITAVTIDGAEWDDLSTVRFDPDTGWTNLRGCDVEVTYQAGFEEVPDDLVALTLGLAARGLGSPLGLVREQAGTVAVTYTQAGFNQAASSTLLPGEKIDLDATYKLGRLP